MCGRFAFYSPAEATAALFGARAAPSTCSRAYNIAPTQRVAAVRGDANDRELVALRWGLVPFWAKDPAIGNRMINARAETVAEKPAFRAAYRRRRCLVLADGFYEWHTEGGVSRSPYFISLCERRAVCLRRLVGKLAEQGSGEESLQTTTIITTAGQRVPGSRCITACP